MSACVLNVVFLGMMLSSLVGGYHLLADHVSNFSVEVSRI